MKRQKGYYWVRFIKGGEWHIALWDSHWILFGWDCSLTPTDKMFYEIDEERIKRNDLLNF